MKIVVFANPRAGTLAIWRRNEVAARLREAFGFVGVDAEVRLIRGKRLTDEVRAIRPGSFDAVVAAGGDGTINAVANALVGGETPLGVLPVGTLNHFSKDLGIPTVLEDAIRTIATGTVRAVDVGDVNGRIFVNNSSIGLYPRMVRGRDSQRMRLGRGKWIAMFVASLWVFRRFPVLKIDVHLGDQRLARTTPFVFVGNNEYQMDLLSLGSRIALDSGSLSLYVGNSTGRFGMLRLAVLALLGRLRQVRDFDLMSAADFTIYTRKRRLRVAVDGEVISLRPPLHYRTRPAALRVLVPSEEAHP